MTTRKGEFPMQLLRRAGCVFVAWLLLAASALADNTLPQQRLSRVSTDWGGQGIWLDFEPPAQNVEGCTSGRVFIAEGPMLERILSIALAAFSQDRPVEIRVSGCEGAHMRGIAIHLYE